MYGTAIHEKIRKVDICTRYSSMQYLLILYEPDETQISKVMDRIFQYYDTLYDKKDFKPSYEYRQSSIQIIESFLHSC